MSDDVSKLLIAVLSAVGGFIASFVPTMVANKNALARERESFANNRALRRADLLREKGEELYADLEKLLGFIYGRALRHREVILGNKSAQTAFDEDLAADRDISEMKARIPLLIDAYYPEALLEYTEFTAAIEGFDGIVFGLDASSVGGKALGPENAKRIDDAGENVQEKGKALKQRIVNEIRLL
jgi:hypothetical protein